MNLGRIEWVLEVRRARMGRSVRMFGQNPSDGLASCLQRMASRGSKCHPVQVRTPRGGGL